MPVGAYPVEHNDGVAANAVAVAAFPDVLLDRVAVVALATGVEPITATICAAVAGVTVVELAKAAILPLTGVPVVDRTAESVPLLKLSPVPKFKQESVLPLVA
jgi:hypothetical protein